MITLNVLKCLYLSWYYLAPNMFILIHKLQISCRYIFYFNHILVFFSICIIPNTAPNQNIYLYLFSQIGTQCINLIQRKCSDFALEFGVQASVPVLIHDCRLGNSHCVFKRCNLKFYQKFVSNVYENQDSEQAQ